MSGITIENMRRIKKIKPTELTLTLSRVQGGVSVLSAWLRVFNFGSFEDLLIIQSATFLPGRA